MSLRHPALLALAGLALAGCPGEQESPKPDFTTDVKATPRAAGLRLPGRLRARLGLQGGHVLLPGRCARQCAQPSDCAAAGATCSERGRCLAGGSDGGRGGGAGDLDVEPGSAITELPARIQQVAAGTDVVKVAIKVAPAPASGVVSYRVERTDGLGDPQKVRQAAGTGVYELEVESGLPGPLPRPPRRRGLRHHLAALPPLAHPQLPRSGYRQAWRSSPVRETGIPLDLYVVPTPRRLAQPGPRGLGALAGGPGEDLQPAPQDHRRDHGDHARKLAGRARR
jgi:hypothetical protein